MKQRFSLICLALFCAVFAQNGPSLQHRLASPDARTRQEALRELSQKPANIAYLNPLLKALDDGSPAVRMEAVKIWGKVGNGYDREFWEDSFETESASAPIDLHKTLIDKLVAIVAKDAEPMQQEVMRTLCLLGDSVQNICPTGRRCGNGMTETLWYKVGQQMQAFAKSHSKLVLRLQADSDPQVAFSAICASPGDLWKDQGHRVKDFLASPNKYFRAMGMWIASDAPPKVNFDLISPLLDDKDEDVRDSAQTFLDLTPEDAMRYATNVPGRSKNLRLLAIQRTGWNSEPKRDAFLKGLLADPEPSIRSEALSQLMSGFEDEKKDKQIIRRMLQDPSVEVKATALGCAAQLDMDGLLPIIKEGLLSDNRDFRETAVWSTMHVEGCEALSPEVVKAVEKGVDDNWMASPDFDNPKFAYLVEECLKSKVPDVRQLLSFHYSGENASKPAEIMFRLARDPDPDVARLIIPSLHKTHDTKAFDVLIELLGSKHAIVRRYAIDELGELGNRSAIPYLEKFVQDKDRDIRRSAQASIKQIKETGPPPP